MTGAGRNRPLPFGRAVRRAVEKLMRKADSVEVIMNNSRMGPVLTEVTKMEEKEEVRVCQTAEKVDRRMCHTVALV